MIVSENYFRKSLTLEDFCPENRNIVQDYVCPLCQGIILDPVVDPCAHIYCRTCILSHLSRDKTCPINNILLDEHGLNRLEVVNGILEKQMVRCKNRDFYCDWVGKLSELFTHLNVLCRRQLLDCTNKGCEVKIFREDLECHLELCDWRIVNCLDCQISIPYVEVPPHQDLCPKYKLCCIQQCGTMIEREQMGNHVASECTNTVVNCPFVVLGCNNRVPRGELNEYMDRNRNSHALLNINFLTSTKDFYEKKIESLESQLNQYEERLTKLEQLQQSCQHPCSSNFLNQTTNPLSHTILLTQTQQQPICTGNVQNKTSPMDSHRQKGDTKPSKKSPLAAQSSNSPQTNSLNNSLVEKLTNKKRQRTEEDNPVPSKVDLTSINEMDVSEDENQNINSVNLPKKECFDTLNISKGVSVSLNRALCNPGNNKSEHRFVFGNLTLKDKEAEWKVVMNTHSTWLGVGICSKETVISNKYRFYNSNPMYNHGCFLISTNGYSWNCNYFQENNFLISNFPTISKGDIITFKYSPEIKELSYKIANKFSGKLTNINDKVNLVPCVIFLHSGDEIVMAI